MSTNLHGEHYPKHTLYINPYLILTSVLHTTRTYRTESKNKSLDIYLIN